MTGEFIARCGLNESIATAHSYECIDIIESAHDAMKDGISIFNVFKTTSTYTQSLVWELLDNVKESLLKMCQRVLSALNNLQVNNIRLVKRYQEVLLERVRKLDTPVVHKTFTYPDMGNYPAVIAATTVERDIARLQADIRDTEDPPSPSKIATSVDRILSDFTKQVIGQPATLNALKESVETIARKKARGKSITVEITRDNLNTYMNQLDSYQQDKAKLMKLKKSVVDEYQAIKSMYTTATSNPTQLAKNTLRYQVNPDKEEFLAHEYGRYADIHVEMLRLFNGFITVYSTAFNTVLAVLDEKIEDRKNLIVTMFATTGIFSALNTKEVGSYDRPIKYTPPKV